jgi:ABC-type molybdenum transport system ATPase subunit/photorepair protein PhrA
VSTSAEETNLASVFEERAEFLSRADLKQWTQITPNNRQVLSKLKGPGAKLLTGPRGSGKSTLLRAAFFDLIESDAVLPVYVNYARSLALEPLFHHNANALSMFRQWALCKIVVGAQDACAELSATPPPSLVRLSHGAQAYIDDLGAGREPESLQKALSPGALTRLLESWAMELGRKRVVLLLDDAAHAFSQQQQREFFEIFRELRSSRVAAKAAVYPGITSYSPNMHVGHEAELIEAWYRPDADDYLSTMRSLLDRRLPASLLDRLAGREELVDYLALGSFGLPRGFLVMLRQVLGVEEDDANYAGELVTPTKRAADRAVNAYAQSVRGIFVSLAEKMPRYRRFVEVGSELERAMARALTQYNSRQSPSTKAVVVGIAEPLGPQLSRVLAMLEYSGAVRKNETVSRGEKGVFQRYELHWALVIQENALSLGRSVSVAAINDALSLRDAHAFVRSRGERLLGSDFAERCTLDLAPCQACGTPRVSEEAQFCMKCGRPLSEASIYEELLKAPIDRLPLTPKKLTGLKAHSALRTVGDVLLDDESREIRQVPYIGPIWSERIHRYAEEYVSV